MSTPEDQINNLTGFLDPFHLVIPRMDPNVAKYKQVVKDYNATYYDLVKKKGEAWVIRRGIKPMVILETSGTSFSLPHPDLIEGAELAGIDLTRGATEQTEAKIEKLKDDIAELQTIANSSAGGGARAPPPGYSPAYTDETNTSTPRYEHIPSRQTNEVKDAAKAKYGSHVIKSETLLKLIVHLFTDKKGFAPDSKLNSTQ